MNNNNVELQIGGVRCLYCPPPPPLVLTRYHSAILVSLSLLLCCLFLLPPPVVSSNRLACSLTYNFLYKPTPLPNRQSPLVLTRYRWAILVSLSSSVVFLFSCRRWCPPPARLACSLMYNFLYKPLPLPNGNPLSC